MFPNLYGPPGTNSDRKTGSIQENRKLIVCWPEMGCARSGRYRCRKREGSDGKSAKENRDRNKRN